MNRVLAAIGTAAAGCFGMTSLAWAAPSADLSGDWQFNAKLGQTPIILDCELRQTGATLAGNCEPRNDDSTPAPLTGSVSGSQAKWDHYILMFSKDGEIVMDEGTRHGREDIRNRMSAAADRMAKAAAGKPVLQSVDLLANVEVRVRGDLAHASSRFTFIAENEAHQFVVRGSGLYTDTWSHENGEWLIKRRKVAWDLLQGAAAAPAGKKP